MVGDNISEIQPCYDSRKINHCDIIMPEAKLNKWTKKTLE